MGIKVSREMLANYSRPVRLLQLMLMPVRIAIRAICSLTPSPNLSILNRTNRHLNVF